MTKFEIYLSFEDTERLFEIKRQQGKNDLNGNDFAKELLQRELHRLHPHTVKQEDSEDY